MLNRSRISEVLNDAATNDSIVVTVITGEGDFYSSGNDISAALQSGGDIEENIRLSLVILEKMIRAFFTHPKLLVSVVNGPCIGIAATTAVLCDVIYATDNVCCHDDILPIQLNLFDLRTGVFLHTILAIGTLR